MPVKPKYDSPEAMQEIIDAYFADCEGVTLHDPATDEVIFNKFGNPVILGAHPPTITGLALALGFCSRQSLLNYQAKKRFVDTITRAKARVEEYTEKRLFDRDGVQGAKFSLRNNFSGWCENPDAGTGNALPNNLLEILKTGAGDGDDLDKA